MVAAKPLVVLVAMVVSVDVGSTLASSRHARQAVRTCGSGTSCQPLSACQYFQDILKSPSGQVFQQIQQAVCRYDRTNPRVCCPGSGSGTPTPTPPTRLTLGTRPTQPTPTPTPTVNPGNGEALLPSSCGQGTISGRVVHGEDAPLGAFPWMAVLGYGRVEIPDWSCGGALITDRYVVTATHCVTEKYTYGATLVVVRLGEHNLRSERDCVTKALVSGEECTLPVQDFTPEVIIPHPTFDKRTNYSDDIALIRLDRPATFNSYVRPICLPPANLNVGSFIGNRQAVAAGWGLTHEGQHASILQQVQLPFVDLESCRSHFTKEGLSLTRDQQVCFGGEGERDTCRGDSGGPLFISTDSGFSYVLLGVVSFGSARLACGTIGVPAVYANVASYRSWITSNLRP